MSVIQNCSRPHPRILFTFVSFVAPEHWQRELSCIALTMFSQMLRNLRSPAADDEFEMVDDVKSVDIKYRLRSHCSKRRLLVLALVLLFLAGAISAVVFLLTKKSNSEGMWPWNFDELWKHRCVKHQNKIKCYVHLLGYPLGLTSPSWATGLLYLVVNADGKTKSFGN